MDNQVISRNGPRRSAIHEKKHFNPSLLPLSSPIHLPLRTIANLKSENSDKKESQTPTETRVSGMEFMKTPIESPIVTQKNNKSLLESLVDSSTISTVEAMTKNSENSFKEPELLKETQKNEPQGETQQILEKLRKERDELILKLEKIKKEEQILLEKIVHNVKQVDKIILETTK
jgi:hypothetical protein